MQNIFRTTLWATLLLGGSVFSAFSQTAPPAIFYSDLQSGPNSGGENNNGAYVTIYGARFGATQGGSYVTIGSGKAVNYKLWTDGKVSFQLGPAASSGNIAITTASGTSTGVPFTVRAGHIYFVGLNGNDGGNGSFASPWRTIVKAKNTLAPGDIAYIMNGVTQAGVDNYSSDLSIQSAGTASSPLALVAYPGATVTIGTNSATYGARTPAISGAKDYWVLAGLQIRGLTGLDLVNVTGWRIVGNDFSCPDGSGQTACVHTDTTTNLKFYGNYVHNVGDTSGTIDKYYHGVYFTTNSNHIDVGWNTVVPNPTQSTTSGGCRAIQFYSTGGSDQFDLHVHDNLIHDAICDGINFSTVNPDGGTVEAYNNVIYHVGTGPDPVNGSSNYSCIVANSSSARNNSALLYNNTLYDCGPIGGGASGAFSIGTKTQLRNNVVEGMGSENYLAPTWNSNCSIYSGSNNLWYGLGLPPSCLTSNISSNPLFVNAAAKNFRLQSGSPAIDAGTPISNLLTDMDGIHRPQAKGYDVGAFEYYSGSPSGPSTQISCDVNADGVVNATDVQVAISQAIGTASCGSADLQQNGSCNVVDVQRVINASLGQACRIGS
jgi:IPT/TIG domain